MPRWLAAGCGPPFVAALDALLDWAAPRWRPLTIADFLAEQPPAAAPAGDGAAG